jgi:hypothetical protein
MLSCVSESCVSVSSLAMISALTSSKIVNISRSCIRGSLMNRCCAVHSHLPVSKILIFRVSRSTILPFSLNLAPRVVSVVSDLMFFFLQGLCREMSVDFESE